MNTFGKNFRVTIFGESHGASVGVVIDGCPAGIALNESDLTADINRRKSGAKGTTPRIESDVPKFLSGVFNNTTTGAPITIVFENNNVRSKDYSNLIKHPRPGHVDFVAWKKYNGYNDYRGGGHFSGRLTLALVAAGIIAKKILPDYCIQAKLIEVGGEGDIPNALSKALHKNDSVGGVVECNVSNLPVGVGNPYFESVQAMLAQVVFSLPAIKGLEFGAGFAATKMYGSEHNDNIINAEGVTETNNAGGLNGGITNGNDIVFRVAVKPTSSISLPQLTYNIDSQEREELVIKGRHDTCIALRVPPVIEAVTAIVLCNFK